MVSPSAPLPDPLLLPRSHSCSCELLASSCNAVGRKYVKRHQKILQQPNIAVLFDTIGQEYGLALLQPLSLKSARRGCCLASSLEFLALYFKNQKPEDLKTLKSIGKHFSKGPSATAIWLQSLYCGFLAIGVTGNKSIVDHVLHSLLKNGAVAVAEQKSWRRQQLLIQRQHSPELAFDVRDYATLLEIEEIYQRTLHPELPPYFELKKDARTAIAAFLGLSLKNPTILTGLKKETFQQFMKLVPGEYLVCSSRHASVLIIQEKRRWICFDVDQGSYLFSALEKACIKKILRQHSHTSRTLLTLFSL